MWRCTSSTANKIPATGALNAAASPALAPQVIKNFSTVLFFFSFLETNFPLIAPI